MRSLLPRLGIRAHEAEAVGHALGAAVQARHDVLVVLRVGAAPAVHAAWRDFR